MENFETALTKEACIICAAEINGAVIINTKLTPQEAEKVKDLHGKVVGYAKEPCEKCKKDMGIAFLFIGFDEDKTDFTNIPNGFFRTGHIIGIKKDAEFLEPFLKEHAPEATKQGFLFTPINVLVGLGLMPRETYDAYVQKSTKKV